MEYALAIVLLVLAVALVVTRPLVRGGERMAVGAERRDALEAAKEVKYREIRDAELDFRTGKLSEADWRATDRELRREAIAILRELDTPED